MITSEKVDIMASLIGRYKLSKVVKLIGSFQYLDAARGHPALPGDALQQHLPIHAVHHTQQAHLRSCQVCVTPQAGRERGQNNQKQENQNCFHFHHRTLLARVSLSPPRHIHLRHVHSQWLL